ncbi:hypothetical protein TNIN_337691 [Trichonephila inaurata madagascariensis]|uniref:Uncharacterized protein n=1 Tax=Trichonephila inaurata madagascariensis TaxID=2747483 RepID=A0A8X6J329_9ARAC|nr:hypothetical protein TNIN_337691 [Trichonephila inaurata madagascariensis]
MLMQRMVVKIETEVGLEVVQEPTWQQKLTKKQEFWNSRKKNPEHVEGMSLDIGIVGWDSDIVVVENRRA